MTEELKLKLTSFELMLNGVFALSNDIQITSEQKTAVLTEFYNLLNLIENGDEA